MAAVNKWYGIGNLGRDPESNFTQSGTAVCNISIACTRTWKNKAGEKQEETEWIRIVFFDRLAEIAQQYLAKGNPVYVEGRLKARKWTDKDGIERYSTEVIAQEMQLLGSKDDAGGGERQHSVRGREPAGGQAPAAQNVATRRPTRAQASVTDDPFGPPDDDDINF